VAGPACCGARSRAAIVTLADQVGSLITAGQVPPRAHVRPRYGGALTALPARTQSGAQWGYSLIPLQAQRAVHMRARVALPGPTATLGAQVFLVPIAYMTQELTVRLGIYTQMGQARSRAAWRCSGRRRRRGSRWRSSAQTELVKKYYGQRVSWFVTLVIVCSCTGGIISEMTGIVGVGAQRSAHHGPPSHTAARRRGHWHAPLGEHPGSCARSV
jgi:hypothetical protein